MWLIACWFVASLLAVLSFLNHLLDSWVIKRKPKTEEKFPESETVLKLKEEWRDAFYTGLRLCPACACSCSFLQIHTLASSRPQCLGPHCSGRPSLSS